tara:strand:+ start:45663 stop:46145 length:483 start_codon:yes stop_codon:yes gene_type:complete
MKILIDGEFFAEWKGSLEELAEFLRQQGDDIDIARLSYDTADLAASLIPKNNAAFEQAMLALTADYPPSEISSWERQRAEALGWQADNTAPTPWIDVAAQVRGVPRAEYLQRTAAKVALFAQASAFLVGRRQAIDDAIRQATTSAELEAIVIDYTLPGDA